MKAQILIAGAIALLMVAGCKPEEVLNQPPTCKITGPADGQQFNRGDTITVSAEAVDPDGSVSEVKFFIDETNKTAVVNPPYSFDWVTTGEDTGDHVIKATSFDNQGASASDEVTVTLVSAGSAPVAGFTVSETAGIAPFTVTFSDTSLNKPSGWHWDFGDGNSSNVQNPEHMYVFPGSYTVSLIVSNEWGADTLQKTGYVNVGGGEVTGEPCPNNSTVTDADGNVYHTVQIGSQCWMKENLNVGVRIKGTEDMTNNGIIEKYCYDDDPANCDKYGGLYQWFEMMQYTSEEGVQGICPEGWHIPTDGEWKVLELTLGMAPEQVDQRDWRGTEAGGKMKAGSMWNTPNTGATNASGFTGFPGGFREFCCSGDFVNAGKYGFWWTSSPNTTDFTWYRILGFDQAGVERDYYDQDYGFSVRCIKN